MCILKSDLLLYYPTRVTGNIVRAIIYKCNETFSGAISLFN